MRLPRHLLLILALVFSQGLLAAHAAEHPERAADHACTLCLHAQHLDAADAPATQDFSLCAPARAVFTCETRSAQRLHRALYRSRAPPLSTRL